MTAANVPLSILDLSPISVGSTAADAYRHTLDLARRAEQLGYQRYWMAEHHFTPGVGSSVPALLMAHVGAVTTEIRLGAGAVQLGHQTAISVVEQFGFLDAAFPGRIDLGLGRSGQRRAEAKRQREKSPDSAPRPRREAKIVDGLLIPAPFDFSPMLRSPQFAAIAPAMQQPGAGSQDFAEHVDQISALLAGTYVAENGVPLHAVPGEGATPEVWIFGSSGGQSAQVAGERGIRFAANYHVNPATILDAVDAYRAAFQPSAELSEPYVMVSADVVVADDDATARHLASPYAMWVQSIRSGAGAIPYPSPDDAAAFQWTDGDRDLVADRVDTQFVGSPQTVADKLRVLQRVTAADELVVTTITHDHADRVRSFELLARVWLDERQGPGAPVERFEPAIGE